MDNLAPGRNSIVNMAILCREENTVFMLILSWLNLAAAQ